MKSGGEKHGIRTSKTFRFDALLQSQGWISPAYVTIDGRGIITRIDTVSDPAYAAEAVSGFALPGFQNAHSHAFQFAMAGTAERHSAGSVDDFWTWREAMYRCALQMDPDQLMAVAAMLYAELLRKGYTHVAEFQYLHHDRDGKPYANRAEMSVSLVAAAAIAGIRITLVPVFYQTGGFGKRADPGQRRFCFKDTDEYFQLLDDCSRVIKSLSGARIGFGVHSLRAAESQDILRIVEHGPRDKPFHMHAAEQLQEVDDSVAWLNQRPVEWILDHLPVGERFHLIHCTHLTAEEVVRLASSRANVVLCPGTEANLADGIFRLTEFAGNSGQWSIGTDSHISLNPLEDLRWLDYGQRLTSHRRNTFPDGASVLISQALLNGRRAMGMAASDFFEPGFPLDAVIYRADSPLLQAAGDANRLSALVYTADSASILGTIVGGQWLVKDYQHIHREEIASNFDRSIRTIIQA